GGPFSDCRGVPFHLAATIYGVLSYTVSQRRREIGVRMALGAGRGQVVKLVVGQGGVLVAAGVVLGLVAAATASRIVESVLFGVTPADPLTFTAVTAVLLGVALLACWLPARRAARIDPMNVLREA
ncbi:MAG: FtsX-like permease family protein, partial [Acidobacteria bacterium]|nr:FtsX-like permease family protein [Acidobacteriota bacterium]